MNDRFNFRGREILYQCHWDDDNIFVFQFGDGEFTDLASEYFIHFEYHLEDNKWVIEVWWEDDNIDIKELDKCDTDKYITENEIEEVKKYAKKFMD